MTTLTSNYGWSMPDPGGSPNTWGDTLNQTTGKIDAAVKLNELAGVPIGSGALWFGATAPTGWILLQGQTLTRSAPYDKLFAIFGVTYNVGTVAADSFMLPNPQGRFLLGASGSNALGSTGGTFSYTIAAANLPAHTHTATQGTHSHPITDVAHTHTASQPAHTHPDPGHTHGVTDPGHFHTGTMRQTSGFFALAAANPQIQASQTDAAVTGISIQAALTNLQAAQPAITVVASGTGLSTTQATSAGTITVNANTGGGQAISVVPPYLAVNFMVKYA